MGKHSKSGVLMRSVSRRKEGFPIPVETKHITLPDGTTGAAYGVDLSDVEVPDRHYHARTCGIDHIRDTVELLFAQPRRDDQNQLRTLLVVSMPTMSTYPFVEGIDHMQNPSLADIVSKTKISSESVTTFRVEAEQTVEVDANIIATAISGNDSCLDFYHASAFSIAALPSTNRLNLIPVVRVNIRTSLLLGLIECLREFQKDLPPNVQKWG